LATCGGFPAKSSYQLARLAQLAPLCRVLRFPRYVASTSDVSHLRTNFSHRNHNTLCEINHQKIFNRRQSLSSRLVQHNQRQWRNSFVRPSLERSLRSYVLAPHSLLRAPWLTDVLTDLQVCETARESSKNDITMNRVLNSCVDTRTCNLLAWVPSDLYGMQYICAVIDGQLY
jgi:hypothetical protein